MTITVETAQRVKKIPARVTVTLLASMSLASLVLRYPGNHELGYDSFFVHTLAQSIVSTGQAKWAFSLFSYFGWYPLSYPSGVPFQLAAMSELSSLNVEATILLLSLMLGLVGILNAFLMAREFRFDDRYALLVALAYGFAPRFLDFTLWQASTRDLFMAVLPLFIWGLLRFRRQPSFRNLSTTILMLIVLAAAHRLVVLVAIITGGLVLAMAITTSFRALQRAHPRIRAFSSRSGSLSWVVFACIVLSAGSLLLGTNVLPQYSAGEIATGSSLGVELLNLGVSVTRTAGLAAPLAVIGLVGIPWFRGHDLAMMFCVASIIALIPALSLRLYTGFYVLPFLAVLSAYLLLGLMNKLRRHRRMMAGFTVVAVISTVIVSGALLQYERGLEPRLPGVTYSAGAYLAKLDPKGTVVCNQELTCSQLAAIAGEVALPAAGGTPDSPSPLALAFGFYSAADVNARLVPVPLADITVNSNSLWAVQNIDPYGDYVRILQSTSDGIPPQLDAKYHPNLYVELSAYAGKYVDLSGNMLQAPLSRSLHASSYALYADGTETVWLIP